MQSIRAFFSVAVISIVLIAFVGQSDAATYSITADAGNHGSIAPRGMISVNSGGSQTFTITPDFGYAVAYVLIDNSAIYTIPASGGTYTFSNVTSNHSIWPAFIPISFTISGTVKNSSGAGIPWVSISFSNNGGMVATDNNGNYTQSVPYNYSGTVTPFLTGYSFSPASRVYTNVLANQTSQDYQAGQAGLSVTPSSRNVGSAAGTTTFSVSNTGSGTMAWSAQTADSWLSITSGSSGTNSGTIACSFQANTTAASRTGSIKVWATAGAAGSPTEVKVVQSAPGPLTITASAGTGGSITPSGSVSVNYGSDQSFTINPSTGYEVAGVTVDSAAITTIPSAGGTYTFSKVTANHTIAATFKSKTLTISGSTKTASGAAVSAVTISFSNNGGTATSDTSGNYSIAVPYNYSGTATPAKTGYSFTPASRTYSNVVANQISQDYQANQAVISVTPLTRNVGSAAGTTTFSVSNTGSGTMAWTAVSGSSWLMITSGASGTNSGTISCNFLENTDAAQRTGAITITATGAVGSPIDVKVTQSGRLATTVPETGQTKCYNAGDVIKCPSPGEPFYGQDASYNINPISYTKLDGTGKELPDSAISWSMVKDNVTGLIWEVKTNLDGIVNYSDPHDSDNTYTWYDSNPATNGGNAGTPGDGTDTEDFIKTLNNTHFGGFNDWRIPTIKELESISNYGIIGYAAKISTVFFLNNPFPPDTTVIGNVYWSSTTRSKLSNRAWFKHFTAGYTEVNEKRLGARVLAVRGGQAESIIDKFIDNGDGTVTDTSTGLMWQQGGSTFQTWEQTLSYCETLNLGGYTDWRLPTVKELQSLVDYSRSYPAIDTTYFPNTSNYGYFSSTTNGNTPNSVNDARSIFFSDGQEANSPKGNSSYVRAVRGGQTMKASILKVSPIYNNVSKESGTTTFSIFNEGTEPMSWTASVISGTDWLSITSGNSGTNSGTITCKFYNNTSMLSRIGSIQVVSTGAIDSPKEVYVIQSLGQTSVKLIGAWSDGIWSWDINTNKWALIPSTSNVSMVSSGKIDTDNIDDLIGVWPSGLYVRKSTTGQWNRLTASLPNWIASGDLNNDGLDDIIGSWKGDGVYYWNSANGSWNRITSPAEQIASGNIGGVRDDLAGVWSDGLWVQYSATSAWHKINSSIPYFITTADMTGGKRDGIIGSYSSGGTWYRDSSTGAWTLITSTTVQLASGDLDADGKDDLIGVFSDGSVRVRCSRTFWTWQTITTSKPKWITTGRIVEPNQSSVVSNDPVDQLNVIDMSASGPGNNVIGNVSMLVEEPVATE